MCKGNHVKCKNHRHSIVLLNPLESVTEQRNQKKRKRKKPTVLEEKILMQTHKPIKARRF